MSKSIKQKLANNDREIELNEFEFNFLKELNTMLTYHVARNQIMSRLLTYIVTNHGMDQVREGYDLQFDIDLADDKKRLLKVIEVKLDN